MLTGILLRKQKKFKTFRLFILVFAILLIGGIILIVI